MQPIQPAVPGQPLRAVDINASAEEVRRLGNVSVEGAMVSSEGTGVHLTVPGASDLFAKIMSKDTSISGYPRYGWQEVVKTKTAWVHPPNARFGAATGDFALEFNHSGSVANGTVVSLRPLLTFVESARSKTIYGFMAVAAATTSGGNAVIEVVTDVICTPSGIEVSTVTLSGADYDNAVIRQFTALSDVTQKSYVGNQGRAVVVNASATGLEFGAVIGEAADTFIALTDTPPSYSNNAFKVLTVSSSSLGISFSDNNITGKQSIQGGGNPNDPVNWQPLSLVNDATSPVAFAFYGCNDAGVRGWRRINLTFLGDCPASYTGQGGKALAVNAAETGIEFVAAGGASLADITSLQAQIAALDARITALGG